MESTPRSKVARRDFLKHTSAVLGAGTLSMGMTACGGGSDSTPAAPQCLTSLPDPGRSDFLTTNVANVTTLPRPDGIVQEFATITGADGIQLSAVVYRPAGNTPVPVLTTMTIYGKTSGRAWGGFKDLGTFYLGDLTLHDGTSFEAWDPGHWVPQGYAVVVVDCPGTGDSQANRAAPKSIQQRCYEIIDWTSKQTWCDGNVAMGGVSALANFSYHAALTKHPALKCVMIWEAFNNMGPGAGFGGITETALSAFVGSLIAFQPADPRGPETFFGPIDIDAINLPCLICASFSDQEMHTFDTFEAYMRMQTPESDKWLYNHRGQKWINEYGTEQLALQGKFFDRYLRGNATAMTGVPPLRLEVSEARTKSKIITPQEWPLPNTQYRTLNLDTCKLALTESAVASTLPALSFGALPVNTASNRAAFHYKFDQDTDIVGYMGLKLWIEVLDGDDADLFVGVEKLDAKGEQVFFFSSSGGNANGPVSRGWLRLSARELNPALSTPWRPVRRLGAAAQKVKAGDIVPCEIMVMPSGTTFRRGETLRLVVQSWSSWDTGGEPHVWDTIKTNVRLHAGGRYDSRLILPVVS